MIPILDNSANPIHPCNETDLSKSNVNKDIMIPKKSKYLSKREIIEIFNKYR